MAQQLVELTMKISDYLLESYDGLRGKVGAAMGGEVLELLTDKLEKAEDQAKKAEDQAKESQDKMERARKVLDEALVKGAHQDADFEGALRDALRVLESGE